VLVGLRSFGGSYLFDRRREVGQGRLMVIGRGGVVVGKHWRWKWRRSIDRGGWWIVGGSNLIKGLKSGLELKLNPPNAGLLAHEGND